MKIKKPRILVFAPFPPPLHGSAAVSMQIRNSKVVNDAFSCDFINISTSSKISEIGHLNPSKILRHFSAFIMAFSKLVFHKYDLCYLAITCHGKSFLKDAPFVLLCKLFGRRIVIHQHNKGMSDDLDRRPYKWLLPFVYKNVYVLLLSWRLYPDIERVVPKDRVLVCPNGIQTVNHTEVVRDNPIPRILFLSNLIESKGLLVMLDALDILRSRGYSFICDIVGADTREISPRRMQSEIEARGLKSFVTYHGKKTGADKEAFLMQNDIFVFPTFYDNECFPLVLLEAMQYGMSIVTTDEGGIADIVTDGVDGLICEKRSPESLADRLQILFDNPQLRNRLGRNAGKRFRESFTQDIFESTLCRCFNSILNR